MPGKKKGNYVALLRTALKANGSKIAAAMEPYKTFIPSNVRSQVQAEPAILGEWVSAMTELLDNDDAENLAHMIAACNMHIFRAFEEASNQKTLSDSKLIGFLIKCFKRMQERGVGLKETSILESALDMTEVILELPKLRTELFVGIHSELELIAIDDSQAYLNRRIALSSLRAAVLGADRHRQLIGVERLANHLPECDDFFSQVYIAEIMYKLIMKDIKGVVSKLREAWGKEQVQALQAVSPQQCELFVLGFNSSADSSKIASIKCDDVSVGKKRQHTDVHVHCNPTHIQVALPVEDGSSVVDYVDIPLKAMSNAEVKTKVITFKFRAKKLSGEAQKLAGRDQELLFAIAAKEDSLARFWKEVSRHVKASQSKTGTKRGREEVFAEGTPPPQKRAKQEKQSTAPRSRVTNSDDMTLDMPAKGRTPLPHRVAEMHDPSPFQNITGQMAEEDIPEAGIDFAIDKMKEKLVEQKRRKQERGREALEHTMENVQSLVNEYKHSSEKDNDRLQENVDYVKDATEKLLAESAAVVSREKQTTKDIEALHHDFIVKAKNQRELLVAFDSHVEEVVPHVKEQERQSLSKLKEMVDEEFARLETQVSKIQSHEKIMTTVMNFMVSHLE